MQNKKTAAKVSTKQSTDKVDKYFKDRNTEEDLNTERTLLK